VRRPSLDRGHSFRCGTAKRRAAAAGNYDPLPDRIGFVVMEDKSELEPARERRIVTEWLDELERRIDNAQ